MKKPMPGPKKGVRGLVEEWEDNVEFDWSDVTGICGFRDGSCGAIGRAIPSTNNKPKCELVPDGHSLDADFF